MSIKEFYSDYGIDINDPEYCPRCNMFTLQINKDKDTWYCDTCHWRGRLGASKMLLNASEAAPELMRWRRKGAPPVFSLGWKDTDKLLQVRRGEWTVVTGYSSHGKSSLMDAIMVNMMHQHNWKFAMFSPENIPHEQHNKSLVQKFLGKRFNDEKTLEEEIILANNWLKQRLYYVIPPEPTFEAILAQFEKAVKDFKVEAVVLDPFNEVEYEIPYGMTETQYISKVLIKFRKFCERTHVHGFIVAHPSKQSQGKRVSGDEGAGRPLVRLADISGSAHFENKTFNGISVWRNPSAEGAEKHKNYIYVLKVRNQDCGTTGKTVLTWDGSSTCYSGMQDSYGGNNPPATAVKTKLNDLLGDWKKSSLAKDELSFHFGANADVKP